MTEIADHAARQMARDADHKADTVGTKLDAHMALCVTASERNDADHTELKNSVRDFAHEATSRWKWLITIIIGGLAAIITMLIKIITANNTAGWL